MNTFNVINYDFNGNKFVPYDVLPYLRKCFEKKENKPKTFEEFKKFIEEESLYQFWSRCEYEIILHDWPNDSHHEKWDVYKQIMMNIDIVTKLLIEEYV